MKTERSIFSIRMGILAGLLAVLFLPAGCGRNVRPSPYVAKRYAGSGKLVSWETRDHFLYLQYENLCGRIGFVNGNAVWIAAGTGTNAGERYSYAVVDRNVNAAASASEDARSITFRLPEGDRVTVSKSRFETSVYSGGKLYCTMTAVVASNTNKVAMVMEYRGEKFFGLGEKTGKFQLNGRYFTMFNSDVPYGETTDPLYASIPFYLAIAPQFSYGFFADNPARATFSLHDDLYLYEVSDTREDVYVFPGKPGADEFDGILESYTALTGKPYMPPLYGFGFHQSRYSYTNQAQVLWVANQFRTNDLPLDVIYFDIGFMDNNMAFTYDRDAFPDPADMNAKLAKMGVRTVAIVDPGIKDDPDYFACKEGIAQDVFIRYHGEYFTGAVWPGTCYFPDFTRDATTAWWRDQYRRLTSIGIEGFWNDMNEPSVFDAAGNTLPSLAIQFNHGQPVEHRRIHNVYGLSMCRATYAAVSNLNHGRRVFLLTRSAYAGSQRYAFIWTGDNTSSWKHLRLNLSMAMGIGLSGMPYVGADIGGFCGSPDPELFTRWIQLGTFIPFMRDHTQINSAFQEPYVFTSKLDILRKYLKLRYRLLPYLYTQVYRAHATGLPIVKPLFLEFGRQYLGVDSEFLFGSSILVAPVMSRGATNLTVTLPAGKWYGLFDGTVRGGGTYKMPVTIADIPMFVRGGSMIPAWEFAMRSTQDAKPGSEVTWTVYPGADGKASGTLYEDDGISMDFANGGYSLTEVNYAQDGDKASITFRRTAGQMNPGGRFVFVLPEGVHSLTVNGQTAGISGGKASVDR